MRFEVAGFGVDVVLVEPGFIRSGFSEAAAASVGAGGDGAVHASDDPYRDFTAGLVAATRSVYARGPMARLVGTPDDVARVVLEAITSARPKARCPVAASAHLLRGLRVVLSDRAWDSFLSRQFSQPGRPRG